MGKILLFKAMKLSLMVDNVANLIHHLKWDSENFSLFSQITLQLIKCLVLMLDKVMNSLAQLPSDSLTKDTQNRSVNLCQNIDVSGFNP